jgi:hypothetical protein
MGATSMNKQTAYIANCYADSPAVLPIFTTGLSYYIPNLTAETKNGRRRGVSGCRDEREAFRVAKQLARINPERFAATKTWKLILL